MLQLILMDICVIGLIVFSTPRGISVITWFLCLCVTEIIYHVVFSCGMSEFNHGTASCYSTLSQNVQKFPNRIE